MDEYRRGMKAKTIRQIITKKLNDWAESVRCDDVEKKKELQSIIRNKTVVTGGCIASMLLGEDVNDFDIYFRDKESAIKIVNHYLDEYLKPAIDAEEKKAKEENREFNSRISHIGACETETGVKVMIRSAGVLDKNIDEKDYQYFEAMPSNMVEKYFSNPRYYEDNGKYYATMFTDNAITFTDKIQLVLRFIGEPQDIHDNYDFVHCKNYFVDGQLHLDPDAMESLLARELRYVGSLFPICSLFRIRKFLKRGWTIMAGDVFKIAYDVSFLDLHDPKVLEDQLMGVDYAYFWEVIDVLKSEIAQGKELNRTYLFELVNRVFDDLPEIPVESE